MKKLLAKSGALALALLFSSAGFAATVTVTPYRSNGTLCGPGCTVTVGDQFYVDVFGDGFPVTTYDPDTDISTTGVAGATLKVFFSSAVSVRTPIPTQGIILAPGSAFTGGGTSSASPFPSGSITNLTASLTGPLPETNFLGVAAFRIWFKALAPGAANISLFDNGGVYSWSDAGGNPIPVTYTQASVTVAAVPVPAAVWLFGSALGLVGVARRRVAA